MKKLIGAMAALVLTQAMATAQTNRIYTRPAVPSEADLDRLNLKIGWRIYVPTEGRRDGIVRVQVLDNLILVQTVSGTVSALNPVDGSTLWRTRLGAAYRPAQPLGSNEHAVYLVQGTRLFSLDRKTGQLRWEYDMPNAANAAPAADEEHVFVPMGTRDLLAFDVPVAGTPVEPSKLKPGTDKKPETPSSEGEPKEGTPSQGKSAKDYSVYGVSGKTLSGGISGNRVTAVGALSSAREAFHSFIPGIEPRLLWTYVSESHLEGTPLLTADSVVVTDTAGTTFVLSKENHTVRARFPSEAPVSAPMAQYEHTAYIASQDANLYAYDLASLVLAWRFTAGGPIVRKPEVNDDDVYVAVDRIGLSRLERGTGREVWRNPNAGRFLAANHKFVYAAGSDGRLLVLDRARGRQLGSYDAREFVVPVSNQWTDRLYLASHDGLLVCLHDRDRDYRKPLRMRKAEVTAAAPKPEAKPPADMGEDKPKDEDKPKEKPKGDDKPKDKGKPKGDDKPKDKGDDKPKDKDKADDKAKDKGDDKPK
jgi:outer membrane protein assembly factor BamB